jgi:indole-3-glycerol phosphate synthase
MTDLPQNPDRLPAVLSEIITNKREQVAAEQAKTPLSELESQLPSIDPPRDCFAAVTESPRHPTMAVIAEVKRRSPSAGLIRPEYESDSFSPSAIAQGYSNAGASAISCLTDQKYFGGTNAYIHQIKQSVDLPVLRKDFIIDPYQIIQARAIHADAVLLIAECLDDTQISDFIAQISDLDMTTLLEIHSESNLHRVLPIIESTQPHHKNRLLLGINNRDLTAMTTDLHHSVRLKSLVPRQIKLVTESGIRTPQDLQTLKAAGLHIALIGQHLMATPNPGQALADMLKAP